MAGVELGDAELAGATAAGLERVEELLRREVHSDYRFVTETSLHLIEAGGKRFRPLFTLLSAQFADGNTDAVVTAAAAVELVHLATLYHDDVMDEATMRRGEESVNARWDNTVAILTGDFLFAHASRLVADLEEHLGARLINRTTRSLHLTDDGVVPKVMDFGLARGEDPGTVAMVGIVLALVAVAAVSIAPGVEPTGLTSAGGRVIALSVVAGLLFGVFFLLFSEVDEDAGKCKKCLSMPRGDSASWSDKR